jgi:hypothetical protein
MTLKKNHTVILYSKRKIMLVYVFVTIKRVDEPRDR